MTNANKVTWLVSFSHFITHGFMTLFSAVMVVIAAENSMSFMDIGIVATIGYFLYGLGAFPAGYLADKYGSKRVLTIGVFGMSFASILVGISPEAYSFGAAYALLGIFASIHHPAGLSFIARRVDKNKGQALGIHGVMGNVGLFLTPLFGAGCVLVFGNWRSSYILYSIIGFAFALLLYHAKIDEEPDLSIKEILGLQKSSKGGQDIGQESKVIKEEVQKEAAAYNIVPVSLLMLFLGAIFSGYIFRGSLTFFPPLFREEIHFVVNHDFPVVVAGFLTTAVLSLGLIGAWFGGYINDKLKKPEYFPVIIFVFVAPLLYMISRYTDNKLLAVSAIFSLIYYAWQPSQNYLIAKYSKKASHGKWFGVNFFLIFGIGSIATATGGYVSDDFGVDVFYWVMSLIALFAIITSLAVYLCRKYTLRFSCQLEKE